METAVQELEPSGLAADTSAVLETDRLSVPVETEAREIAFRGE